MEQRNHLSRRKENKYCLMTGAAALAIAAGSVAAPAQAQDIWAMGTAKGNAAKEGLIDWAQIGGVISFIVCGLIWIGTGRANFRWLAGAAGGLFIAGLADPIASFFFT